MVYYIDFYKVNTRSRISPLWMIWAPRASAASKYGERTLGRLRTSRSSTSHGIEHAQHFVALLFQKAGRIDFILPRQIDDVGHPGGTTYPDAIRAQGIFHLRPSSAIAPVQSGRTFRCALRVGRVDRAATSVIVAFCSLLESGKGLGALLRLPGKTAHGNLMCGHLFTGMTRREANRLAQDAFPSCIYLHVDRTHLICYSSFLFTSGKRKGSGGPLLRLLGRTVRGNLRWWMFLC